MKKRKIEREMVNRLLNGKMEKASPIRTAGKFINPKYEMRTQAVKDPIVEETNKVREMAEEVDDRYDRYMNEVAKKEE